MRPAAPHETRARPPCPQTGTRGLAAMTDTYSPPEREVEPEGGFMSLGGHLEELRSRVIRSVFVLAAAFILCLFFRNWLWAVLSRPHVMTMRALGLSTQLKYSGYFEVAFVQLKACAAAAGVLASPYLIYQIGRSSRRGSTSTSGAR